MVPLSTLDTASSTPLYRQLYDQLRGLIEQGSLSDGSKLPPTRELAGQLGLNRATVAAAYELLQSEHLISGQVGRGSFVTATRSGAAGVDWGGLLKTNVRASLHAPEARISFASSRPSELLFPLEDFQATCAEVTCSDQASAILQLGSPVGYAPLRRYLFEQARAEGTARECDDILITSGCQQALDLLHRTLLANGETVIVEDPVYAGIQNSFRNAGTEIAGVAVGPDGIDLSETERLIRTEQPRAVVVTPSFQNPTGATIPLENRRALVALARDAGVILIENDIYSELRYEGAPIASLKQIDDTGDVILLRSFSKLAFPGLRVGWIIGPRALIQRLTEAKQWSDLHTDQLSQAVLLRFAESGRLDQHKARMLVAGKQRLHAAIAACERHLPKDSRFTRPQGGMNLWVNLPEPLDAAELLGRAVRDGVTYVPGRHFTVAKAQPGALRLSFAGLTPQQITEGISILGRIANEELGRLREYAREPSPALV